MHVHCLISVYYSNHIGNNNILGIKILNFILEFTEKIYNDIRAIFFF